MTRGYSDPSYGSKKQSQMKATGALNGTSASATTVSILTFMQPVRVTDWNGVVNAGGTDAGVISLIINKSLAGTGAASPIGTMTLGTHTINTVIDAACTSTAFSTGDDVIIQRSAGTSTSVLDIIVAIQYVENFEIGDN